MNDLKPFKHGQEGTHYACEEIFESKGQWSCCGCSGHKCKPAKKRCCKAHDAGFAGPHCNNPVPSPTKEDKKHAHRYWSNICECGHGRPLPKPKVKKKCEFKNCTCAYDHIHEYRACNKWCQTGVHSPTKEVESWEDDDMFLDPIRCYKWSEIKDFIRKTLSESRKEVLEEVLEALPKASKEEAVKHRPDNSVGFMLGWNAYEDELKAKLNKLK